MPHLPIGDDIKEEELQGLTSAGIRDAAHQGKQQKRGWAGG